MALSEAEAGLRLSTTAPDRAAHRARQELLELRRSWRHLPIAGAARRGAPRWWRAPERAPGRAAPEFARAPPRARRLGTRRHRHRPVRAPERPAAGPPGRDRGTPLPEQPRDRGHRQCARRLHRAPALHDQDLQPQHQGAGRTGRHRSARRPGAAGERRRATGAGRPARALQVRRQRPDRHERRRGVRRPAGDEVAGAADRPAEVGRRLGRLRVHRRTVRPPGHPQHPAGRRIPEEHRCAIPDDDAADAQHRRLRSFRADAHHQQEEEGHAVGAADLRAAETARRRSEAKAA